MVSLLMFNAIHAHLMNPNYAETLVLLDIDEDRNDTDDEVFHQNVITGVRNRSSRMSQSLNHACSNERGSSCLILIVSWILSSRMWRNVQLFQLSHRVAQDSQL
jgi:hypothetical protein